MSEHTQLEYVKGQIKEEILLYTERKHLNRKAAFAFTVIPATLAAAATVLIGASEKIGDSGGFFIKSLPILAMTATGIASILSAWESLFSNRKLWGVNNVALTSLYELRSDIEYREKEKDSPITKQETDRFFERLKAIRREGEDSYQRAVGNG